MRTYFAVLVILSAFACSKSEKPARSTQVLDDFCDQLTNEIKLAADSYRKFATSNGGRTVENSDGQLVSANGLSFGLTSSERGVGGRFLASEIRLCIQAEDANALQGPASKAIERFLLASDTDKIAKAMEEIAQVVGEIGSTTKERKEP